MSENLLIIVALIAAGAAFVGILIFFSLRLWKEVSSFSRSEKRDSPQVLVVDRPSTVSNVKTIELD